MSLHILDREGVLFDAASRHIYALDTAATFIWCCLEEGEAPPMIAAGLAQRVGRTPESAGALVDTVLQDWARMGLLGDGVVPLAPVSLFPKPVQCQVSAAPTSEHVLRGRILDSALELRLPSAYWRDRLLPLVAPFLGAAADKDDPIALTLIADDDGLCWHDGERRLGLGMAPNVVAPLLKCTLVELALRRSRDVGALHAAALARGARALLLPGGSGSGKSTLAAGLAATGLAFLGDDTLVLDRATLALRSMPFPICAKPGAWDVLDSRYPALRGEPVHVRPDGKRVRYLTPPRFSIQSERHDVAAIVFPVWTRRAATALTPLARPAALQRLLAGFCPLGEGLANDDVARLVAWIAARDCYELRYAALDEAIARLSPLLS